MLKGSFLPGTEAIRSVCVRVCVRVMGQMGAGILISGANTLSGGGVGWISYANLCRSCLNRGTYSWNVRASLHFYVTCVSVIHTHTLCVRA